MEEVEVVFREDGTCAAIYADDLAEMLSGLGRQDVRRASHVEPCNGGWSADMSPVDGPALGPFARRADALAAEVAWLKEHGTPTPSRG